MTNPAKNAEPRRKFSNLRKLKLASKRGLDFIFAGSMKGDRTDESDADRGTLRSMFYGFAISQSAENLLCLSRRD